MDFEEIEKARKKRRRQAKKDIEPVKWKPMARS